MKEPDESKNNNIWKAGLPGWVLRPWILNNFLKKMTDRVVNTITLRRDYERPLSVSKIEDYTVNAVRTVPYRVLAAILRWFNVYDDEWLWKWWVSPEYISHSDEDKFYDILIVRLPIMMAEKRPEVMNYKTGDYDELLRCLRAIYALCVLSGTVEKSFETYLLDDIRRHYEKILPEDAVEFKLWELPMNEDIYRGVDALKVENLLLGLPNRNPDDYPEYLKKTRLTVNLMIDIAQLFKYIDIHTGSYFMFDYACALNGEVPMVTSSREKRRVGMRYEWPMSFIVEGVWIDPEADVYVIYDRFRRQIKRLVPKVTETVYRSIAKSQTYDFINLEDMRDRLEVHEEDFTIDVINKDLALLDPAYREWLQPEDGKDREVSVEFLQDGERKKLSFTSKVKEMKVEYKLLAAHLYFVMLNVTVPRDSEWKKVEEGIFKTQINHRIKPIVNNFIKKVRGLSAPVNNNLGDYFYSCMIALYDVINSTKFPRRVPRNDFIALYMKYGRNKQDFLFMTKSVLTVLTGSPRISKYIVNKIDHDHLREYKGRQALVDEINLQTVRNKQYWSGEETLQDILRTSAFNVYVTDDIFLKQLLEIKL